MAETITNGTGTGDRLHIDPKNRAHTFSVVETEDKAKNKEGEQWSLYFTTTPVGANDYFFYLKNTSEVDIAITDIRTMCSSAETINYEWVSGVPTYTASADITPVPKNGGSNQVPTATIKSDTDITGLTSDGVIYYDRLDTANKMYKFSTSANIIIPQGKTFALKAVTGTALVTCVVSILIID